MTHRPHPERICGLLLVVMASACGFNPVPEVSLDPAPRGSFEEGDLLHLSFSEAVNPATLRVAIWFEERDVERRFPAGSKPQVSLCTPALSPCACDDRDCGAVDLIMDSDNLGATLALDPKGLGQPDIPLILEVLPGLSDRSPSAATSMSRSTTGSTSSSASPTILSR